MAATRYVKSGGTTTGDFLTKGAPAKSVAAALKVATPGDTIEILDAATYKEPELLLDRALTLTSSYLLANPGTDPTAAGFDPKVLPAIVADGAHRVLRIQGTVAARTTLGPITVRGVRILQGRAIHAAGDPGIGCGGGIAVIDADQVSIERCVFSANRTQAAPVSGWPEPDRLALRQAVLDLLGAIFTPGAESTINTLVDVVNKTSALLGTGIALAHLSRATVLAEVGKSFDTKVAPGRSNAPVSGQAFGGALATVWASPTVSYCLFSQNSANGRGGAIAVTGYGWPTIVNCVVDRNNTLPNGRCDGGGIGCEVAVPSKLGRDLYEIHLVRFLVGKLGGVIAALGSPLSVLSSITASDLLSYAAWLANPLAPNPLLRGVKALLLDAIHGQWSALTDHALYYLVSTALSRNAWDAWIEDEIELAQKSSITLRDCRISRNLAHDDGGGLYASVLSRMALSGTTISANAADDMGGGVRLSMGSAATLAKCSIKGNHSGAGGTRGHDKGGGLAARNVDLTLTDTIIGAAGSGTSGLPGADSNFSGDAPGGGLAFESSSEGALAGIPDMWSSILVEVFGVRKVAVTIGSGCVIGSNGAGFSASGGALSAPEYAKGGGLFVVRGDFPDAPSLTLKVTAARSTVANNVAQTVNYLSRAQSGLKISSANELALQDLAAHREYTEINWGSLIDGSGTLSF